MYHRLSHVHAVVHALRAVTHHAKVSVMVIVHIRDFRMTRIIRQLDLRHGQQVTRIIAQILLVQAHAIQETMEIHQTI